jgi:chromosome segregation ATPase
MVAKYQEQAEELDQTKTELEDTKLIAKQAIESLVTQNGVFLKTISRLQNQVQGLKWNLKQIEGQMKQTKQMLAQQNGTIMRMQNAMGGMRMQNWLSRASVTS